jgi:DHA3 family macrolide efflux protein-like MFS transporter
MDDITNKKTFRHYLYFLFGQQFSLLGSMIVGFVITWWLTVETGSAVVLSISVFLMFVPQIIITPISGVLSDSLQAVVTFVLFCFFLLDIPNIWFVLGINTFRAALFAFQLPAVSALIPAMVPKEKLSRINGMNFLFSSLIFSIGPVVAAVLYELFPLEGIMLLDISTFIIALIPLLLIKIPSIKSIREEHTKSSFTKDFKDGLSVIKAIPGLLAMIAFAMIFNFINRPFNVLLPYFVKFVHDGTAFDLAILMFSFQIASMIGALITSVKKEWKHKIKINIIGVSMLFAGEFAFIFAPKGNFLFMIIGYFPGAIIFPITVALYLEILQTKVSKDKIGRIMSIDHMISMAIAPIGALIAGPLAELLGVVYLFYICALIGLIYPILIWLLTKIRYLEYEKEIEKEVEKLIEATEIPEIIKTITNRIVIWHNF